MQAACVEQRVLRCLEALPQECLGDLGHTRCSSWLLWSLFSLQDSDTCAFSAVMFVGILLKPEHCRV
jgi:hypothetical protein